MTLLAGDCGFYLGSGPLGFQYLLQWNFNYLQKVELYQEEELGALSHHMAINQRQAMPSNPPRQRRELNQVTPTSQVTGRCLWQNCESNLVFCCFSIQEPKWNWFVVNYWFSRFFCLFGGFCGVFLCFFCLAFFEKLNIREIDFIIKKKKSLGF